MADPISHPKTYHPKTFEKPAKAAAESHPKTYHPNKFEKPGRPDGSEGGLHNPFAAKRGADGKPGSAFSKDRERFENSMGLAWKMLETQMLHQNPLDPMKSDQMMAGIQGMTQVEQLVKNNEEIRSLHETIKGMHSLQASSMKGSNVQVEGNEFELEGNTIDYEIPEEGVKHAFIQILDDKNNIVGQFKCDDIQPGKHAVTYCGEDAEGNPLPDGHYRYSLYMTTKNDLEMNMKPRDLTLKRPDINLIYEMAEDAYEGDPKSPPYLAILDSTGRQVNRLNIKGAASKGEHLARFRGIDQGGFPLDPGKYSFKVMAHDQEGEVLPVKTFVSGKIQSVSRHENGPMVNIYGKQMPIEKVIGVI